MNVIPFPAQRRRASDSDVELFQIVAALNVLEEPATAAEILQAILRTEDSDLSQAQVEASLMTFSHAAPTWWQAGPVFRAVDLRGRPAWAFTSAFRIMMRTHGFYPSLRN